MSYDNVIPVSFESDDSGYILNDKTIEGIYHGNLSAHKDGNNVSIGHKIENGIAYPVDISVKDLNQFCIMWLALHDPDSLNYDNE